MTQQGMEQITREVQATFAEQTRYPLDVLELDADFEQELGIDSVKLNEVLAILRQRYGLGETLDVSADSTRTIRGVAGVLAEAVGDRTRDVSTAPQAASAAPAAPATTASANLLPEVTQTFADLTRYPVDVLEPDADLEQDLGIDSVKLNEVLAALRERHGLSDRLEATPDDTRTLRAITQLLERALPSPSTTSGAAGPAPVPDAPTSDSGGVSVLGEVFTTFAELTRYPVDVLEPDADLEQDLGIDSVKLNEVLAVLRERFALPASLEVRTDQVRSIRAVADLISSHSAVGARPSNVARPAESVLPPPILPGAARPAATPRDATQPAQELAGKVILVTGSGHGLGHTTAKLLAARGARVIVNSFHSRDKGESTVARIRADGGEAEHVWGSVAKPEHIQRMFDEIGAKFGELDFFISNASNGHLGPASEIQPEHWEKAFRTNVMGFHLSAIAASRLMKRGGAIVSLSCTGASAYLEHFACLGAVKAAVESLTRSLAVELGPQGIRVNCVSAGPIAGDLLEVYPDRERLVPHWEKNTPTGRLCSEEEVADVVLFLLSKAARQINGSIVTVDGGGALRI